MNVRYIFFIVLALGWMSALGRMSEFVEAQAAAAPTGLGSPSAANAKLEKAVKSMFAQDEQVGRADLTVRADVTKNEVTLSGTVESEAVRSRAVELAKTAHAGVVVNDKMTVSHDDQTPHSRERTRDVVAATLALSVCRRCLI